MRTLKTVFELDNFLFKLLPLLPFPFRTPIIHVKSPYSILKIYFYPFFALGLKILVPLDPPGH